MNTDSARNKFLRDKESFRDRQKEALTKAMERNRLTAKQIAHAVGVHGETVSDWAKGIATMPGDAIEAVEMFFLYLGDFWFFNDLYGELGAVKIKRAQQIEAAARDVRRREEMLRSGDSTIANEASRNEP